MIEYPDMAKTKKLVVGNWKMYPERLDEAKKIVTDVKKVAKKVKRTNIIICPPFVYLSIFSGIGKGALRLGAQNTNSESHGSLTGEVSVSQIEQFKVDYVIVGHSERRKMGESDDEVNKKVKAVLDYGMKPIVCVGESVRDHNGDYLNFIKNQICYAFRDVQKKFLSDVVIAYEPIWAVGANAAMSPRDLHEVSIYIRKILKDILGDFSMGIQILYGGAVDYLNASELIKEGNVSGFLIGRQSLVARDFVEIIKIVDAT